MGSRFAFLGLKVAQKGGAEVMKIPNSRWSCDAVCGVSPVEPALLFYKSEKLA